MVVEKRPADGPITLIAAGASRIPTNSGERVELAVEVLDGQQGAALVAMRIVCDDIVNNGRVPPVGAPWRNSEPFLSGTEISWCCPANDANPRPQASIPDIEQRLPCAEGPCDSQRATK